MASYSVRLTRSAVKELEAVGQKRDRERIVEAIQSLSQQPRPPGSLKLSGGTGAYRIRVGDYRVLYTVDDDVLLVLVVKIGNRRDVYD